VNTVNSIYTPEVLD